jgi:hypothetical protein
VVVVKKFVDLKDPTHSIRSSETWNVKIHGGGRKRRAILAGVRWWEARRRKTSTDVMKLRGEDVNVGRDASLERLLGVNELVNSSREVLKGRRSSHDQ